MDTELKTAIDGIRTSVGGFDTRLSSMQSQLDAVDVQLQNRIAPGGGVQDPLKEALEKSSELARLKELGKGRAVISLKNLPGLETKTTLTAATFAAPTAGVIAPQRVGPIVPLAQRRLFMRDLLSRGNRVSGNQVYFIQESSFVNAASPQASEGAVKAESASNFTTVSKPVTTIAHFLPCSRQVLDDAPALLEFIKNKLLYGLRYVEDLQILSGSGTGMNLSGLIGSAAAFSPALIGSSGWTRIDTLRAALEQVELADEVPAGFFVLNPIDWSLIERTKDGFGRYIVGDPRSTQSPSLWGKPVVVTTAIMPGSFLAGSSESAELFDRMDATIEISTEHQDYFTRN